MTHVAGYGDGVPNVRGVVGWVLLTWLSSVVGVVLLLFAGNWPAALYAVNASICAAGWFLSSARWAELRALLEAERTAGNDDDATP